MRLEFQLYAAVECGVSCVVVKNRWVVAAIIGRYFAAANLEAVRLPHRFKCLRPSLQAVALNSAPSWFPAGDGKTCRLQRYYHTFQGLSKDSKPRRDIPWILDTIYPMLYGHIIMEPKFSARRLLEVGRAVVFLWASPKVCSGYVSKLGRIQNLIQTRIDLLYYLKSSLMDQH